MRYLYSRRSNHLAGSGRFDKAIWSGQDDAEVTAQAISQAEFADSHHRNVVPNGHRTDGATQGH
jgi:hypothetical protein